MQIYFAFHLLCTIFANMKKLCIPFMISVLTVCVGCSSQTSVPVTFEKAKVSKEVVLSAEADAPSCNVVLNVDFATGNNAETAKAINEAIENRLFNMNGLTMQQAVDSFASQYTRDYKQNLSPLYAQDKEDALKRTWYEYNYSIDTETQEGRDDAVVVYLITLDYYEGGAHGIYQQLVMNFDKQSGKQLTLQDVFVPGYEERLTELLLEKLMDLADVKNMEELKAKDYLFSMDMFPSENFILGKDNITFIYNAYEIAPYAMGMTELELSYDELSGILKK